MTIFNEINPTTEKSEQSQEHLSYEENNEPQEYALAPEESYAVSTASSIPTTPTVSPNDPAVLALQQQMRRGASWFYWIAGLSLVNSALTAAQAGVYFIAGLGITMLMDAIASDFGGGPAKVIAIVFNLIVLGCFILFGVFSNRGHRWAFITGIILYGLDTLILVVFILMGAGMIFALAFHVWVLWCLFQGLKALGNLKRFHSPS
ncbi:MAG: hypothetical protein JW709_13140 [Sedimentisphaerales bacterium]|nr:hypothetical protein [Sedimentisphaerales bacterium]